MYATDSPFGQFFDLDGSPLDDGDLYYGVANQNPITNPVAVFWDSTGTLPASQPVPTLNGYPVRLGTPSLVFTSASYSLLVRNKQGHQVYYLADSSSLPSALEGRLASITSYLYGMGLVYYDQALAYTSPSGGFRMRQTITAKNAGCDVSGDVYTALAAALTLASSLGATFEFTAGRTYQLGTAISIPANLQVFTHGAVFEDLNGTTSATPLVSVAGGVTLDSISINIPTTKTRKRAITFTGNGVRVNGGVSVTYADQQAPTVNDDAAVRFSSCTKSSVGGLVSVTNNDRGVQILNSSELTIGGLSITSYVRGILIEDSSDIRIGRSKIKTLSANGSYTPGHVGVLIQSNTVGAAHDITLEDFSVHDSGEHGLRIGGPERIFRVFVSRFRSSNTGGSGIKVLGTDSGTPSSINSELYFTDIDIEDCGTGGLTTNMCGMLLMFCANVQVKGFHCAKNTKLQSGYYGMRLCAVTDMNIHGADVSDSTNHGIIIDATLGDCTRVNIDGGIVRGAQGTGNGIHMLTGANTLRRVVIDGLRTDSNAAYGALFTSAGGTAVACKMRTLSYNDASGPVSCDSTAVTWNGAGIVAGAPAWTAADGSLWQDEGNNTYVLKAATWTIVA